MLLKNDTPRPLRVALGLERCNEAMIPVDAEVCVPFPVLHERKLRLWRSPRAMVGGEALKAALEADADSARAKVGPGGAAEGGWWPGFGGGQEGEDRAEDVGEEVSVPLTPTTFDRKAKVVERHSHRFDVTLLRSRCHTVVVKGVVRRGSGGMLLSLLRACWSASVCRRHVFAVLIKHSKARRPWSIPCPGGGEGG